MLIRAVDQDGSLSANDGSCEWKQLNLHEEYIEVIITIHSDCIFIFN